MQPQSVRKNESETAISRSENNKCKNDSYHWACKNYLVQGIITTDKFYPHIICGEWELGEDNTRDSYDLFIKIHCDSTIAFIIAQKN